MRLLFDDRKSRILIPIAGVELTRFVRALLTADRPVTATALDEGGGGGDLLVTAQAHRHCQLLRTNHHRALFKYQLTLLNVLGGSQESSQHVGPLNLGLEYVNIESKTGNLV